MFSFFKKKPPHTESAAPEAADVRPDAQAPLSDVPAPALPQPATGEPAKGGTMGWLRNTFGGAKADATPAEAAPSDFSIPVVAEPQAKPEAAGERQGWMDRLKAGLRKTGTSIATVFTGTRIDDALYEELEDALLMADTGVKATQHLLEDLKRRVKETKTTEPAAVKGLLAEALTDLLAPLQKPLTIGEHQPTVHHGDRRQWRGQDHVDRQADQAPGRQRPDVLLAAADTFRAAAREQLGVWADRNTVEIVSQEGGDPRGGFDAVSAGKARKKDVVLVDTAGRLPTQLHLMEELKRSSAWWQGRRHGPARGAAGDRRQHRPERAATRSRPLTRPWSDRPDRDQAGRHGQGRRAGGHRPGAPIPVYFIGVGEKVEDLETFNARVRPGTAGLTQATPLHPL
jgi:fused signal recognition particle receptor